jgi:hypothetical protein
MVQNFHLVWLDGSIDEENNDDCRNSIRKLGQFFNAFTNVEEGNTFKMVSGAFI